MRLKRVTNTGDLRKYISSLAVNNNSFKYQIDFMVKLK